MLLEMFVIMIGVALGFLLAMGLAFVIMLNPKVMKLYWKYFNKQMAYVDYFWDEEEKRA